jgi:hypothetical protein
MGPQAHVEWRDKIAWLEYRGDDSPVIDPHTYARYSEALEQQMFYLNGLGVPLQRAIDAAAAAQTDAAFLTDVRRLKSKLEGNPGDGALEVYRDLPSDIAASKRVLERWSASTDKDIQAVMSDVRATYEALIHFQQMIDNTPSDVMAEIKGNIAKGRASRACFVATVIYGSDNGTELDVLRDYRDNVLRKHRLGRIAVSLYYAGTGYALSRLLLRQFSWTVPLLRISLDRFVQRRLRTTTPVEAPLTHWARAKRAPPE